MVERRPASERRKRETPLDHTTQGDDYGLRNDIFAAEA